MTNACIRCGQGGQTEMRLCPACGQIQPRPETEGLRQLESRCDANLYLQGGEALWECREHLSPGRREWVLAALYAEEPVPGLVPVMAYRHEAVAAPQASLLELRMPGQAFAGPDLDSLIRAQGLPDPALSHRWIGQLLESLQGIEARGLCLNAFASPLIRIDEAGDAWLTMPAWADMSSGEAPAARLLQGFSPPQAWHMARLGPGHDRFGLAMVIFHLLTGLSPALWYPDLPRLRTYQYLWGKPVVAFFDALLASPDQQPIADLIGRWEQLDLRLIASQFEAIRDESRHFYRLAAAAAKVAPERACEAAKLLIELQALSTPVLHNPHTLRLIGDLHWLAGQGEAAVSAYGESLRRESLGSTWLQLGRFYLRSAAGDHAEAAFREAETRLPHDPEPSLRLAQVALAAGRTAQAGRWLERSLGIRPTPKARELQAKLALASHAGSGGAQTATGFVLRGTGWDQHFAARFQEFVCPNGHRQSLETEGCLDCGRPMHYLPGESLQGYEILEVLTARDLGRRHRSSTYAAQDARGRRVLIKEITPDKPGRERYAREREALARLKAHVWEQGAPPVVLRAIPRLLGDFEHQGRLYLVQTWQPGLDLESLVRREGPLSEACVREILDQGLRLLEALAAAGLAHGDIKPKNLLWDAESRRLSLIDFDVCVPLQGAVPSPSPGWTAHFASPEQRRENVVSRRSDGFSLGLCALWLLTGLSPELYLGRRPAPGYRHWRQDAQVGSALAEYLERLLAWEPGPAQAPEALREAWQRVLAAPAHGQPALARQILIRDWYRLHAERDPKALLAQLPALLAQGPDARLRYLVGHELQGRGLDAAALPQLRSALVLDPSSPYAYWDLAGIHVRRGQWAQARELLSQSLAQAGPLPETYMALARVHRRLGEPRQALACLARAKALAPPDPALLLEEARSLIGIEAFAAARASIEAALNLDPASAPAYQLLGNLAALQKLPDEALRWGRRAATLDPENPRLHYDLGLSCYRFNRFDEAVASLLRALALAPSLWQAAYYLGSSELLRGRLPAAEAALVSAREGAGAKYHALIDTKLEVIRRGLQQMAA